MDTSAPADLYDVFSEFKDLWDRKREDRDMPAWRDYNMEDFVPWLGWIVLVGFERMPAFSIEYRLWGTGLTQFFGVDLTGKTSAETLDAFNWQEDLDLMEAVATQRCIGIASGPMKWEDKSYKSYSFAVFPLGNDRSAADRLLILARPSSDT